MSPFPAIRVTILQAEGSTPRAAGAVMYVTRTTIVGTIGGGQMEWRALKAARQMLEDGDTTAELDLSLGPSLRQCCGGRVKLALEQAEAPQEGPAPPGAPHALIFGSGHVGRAILHVLQPLPWQVTIVDSRDGYLPEATARVGAVLASDPKAEVAVGPAGAFWIVATHDHDLDLDIVDAVLRRGDSRWLGLIGSSTKRATFERRLIVRGHPPSALSRLRCPMGIPSIQDKHPASIAISVAAELMSLGSQEEPSLMNEVVR